MKEFFRTAQLIRFKVYSFVTPFPNTEVSQTNTYNENVLCSMKLTKVGGVWIANQQLEQRGDNDVDDILLIQKTPPVDAQIDDEVPE